LISILLFKDSQLLGLIFEVYIIAGKDPKRTDAFLIHPTESIIVKEYIPVSKLFIVY